MPSCRAPVRKMASPSSARRPSCWRSLATRPPPSDWPRSPMSRPFPAPSMGWSIPSEISKAVEGDRLSDHHQGQLRRRRTRHARRQDRRTNCSRCSKKPQREAGAAFGRGEVFVERYIAPGQAHRSADPRRSAWQSRSSLGTRLFRAAPASESRRNRAEHRSAVGIARRISANPPCGSARPRIIATPEPSNFCSIWIATNFSSSKSIRAFRSSIP